MADEIVFVQSLHDDDDNAAALVVEPGIKGAIVPFVDRGTARGRPRGARKLATVLAAALVERVVVAENGCRKRITKLEAAVKQLVNRAASGNVRSLTLLLALVQASEAKPLPTGSGAPSADDALVLREITRRLKGDVP